MKQFIDTQLSGILVSAPQTQHMSHVPLKTFTLKRLAIPLIVGRRVMTSFSYNVNHAQYFIKLATDALKDIRDLRNEATITPSCRHQLTSAVAGVLLVFGALVLRDLSSPDLGNLQSDYSHFIEQSLASAAILWDLAQSLPYAKRVHEDCSTIIGIVTAIGKRWHSLTDAQQTIFERSFVADLIPPNIMESFPYQTISPPLLGPVALGDGPLERWEELRGSGAGVLWLF
jgi:hypothetical protein